jgi:hypothetical protein
MRKGTMVAALTSVAVAAAGCGGDDGGDKLSKADLVERADKACLDSALRPVAPPQNAEQAAKQTEDEAKARKDLQEELEKLDPADDVEADYDEFLKKSQEVIQHLERMTALARENKRAEYSKEDHALATVGQSREAVADRIGFKRCGQPFTAEERKDQQGK